MWTGGARDARKRALALEDRHDVAGRIAEPGDARALTAVRSAAGDALGIGLDAALAVVVLHLDAGAGQGVDRLVDVADPQIQDREDGRLVIRLRIDEDRLAGLAVELEVAH